MPAPDYIPNRVWQEYPSTATLLHAADLNNIELGLQDASASAHAALTAAASASGASIVAPAPSGGDDTAVLQPLLTQAQTTGGTLVLRAGTYQVTNLTTAQSFKQPRIVGQGKNYTTIHGTGAAGTSIVKLKGGSGQFSGGHLTDFTIDGAGQVGLEIADACGVTWSRLEFTGALAEGIRFHNEATGGFTEFNQGDAEFATAVVLPIHYKRSTASTAESFHGTGMLQGTVFNHPTGATTPRIQIDQGCFPYNAPLYAYFSAYSPSPLMRNSNTSRQAKFYGHFTFEMHTGATGMVIADDTTGQPIQLSGNWTGLGKSGVLFGALRLNDIIYDNDAGTTLWHKVNKVNVPTSSTSSGHLGHIAADASYFYVCVADDTWRRVALSTF